MLKECILDSNKECYDCGKCELCDIDDTKICDNCCRCLGEADYSAIEITKIIVPKDIKFKRVKNSNSPIKK